MSTPSEDSSSAPPLLTHRSNIFEHCWDALIVVDTDGRIIDWNPGATRTFGWTREEMLGRAPSILQREPGAQTLNASIRRGISENGQWSGEIAFVRKDGSTGICATRVIPMHDAEGGLIGTLGVNREITAEKATEEALIREKLLLRTLIDSLADPIFFKDRERRFLLLNAAFERVWNLALDEVIGRTDADIPALRAYAALYANDDERVIQTGEPIVNREEPFNDINGQQGWFLTSKYPLRDGAGAIIGLVGACRDVTEKRRADLALADEREKLRTILDAMHDSVFVKDLQGRHTMRNAAGMRLFGRTPESSHRTVYELPLPREYADRYTQDDRFVLETGTPIVNREEPFLMPDGGEGFLLTSKFPLRDGAGQIIGLVGIGRDITQMRKDQAERESLHAKLRETQKLESLGILAGGIAHDFNNILTVVLGNACLMLEAEKDAALKPYLREIETAAMRAADLCKQMLAYSGKGAFVVRHLDLNDVIAGTIDLLRISIGKNVELQQNLDPGLPAITADATQLRQVIMNLVINASEAVGERPGRVTISTGVTRLEACCINASHLIGDPAPGDYAYLEVSDNGQGMPPAVIEKIFDPFFTTKFTGRGLGLAAVLGIVRSHRGALKVDSEPGVGTTFKMLFPCAEGPAESREPTPNPRRNTPMAAGAALLVDDEDQIRAAVKKMLEKMGFSPNIFSDGASALEAFAREPEIFSVVVTDLTMGGLDGAQLSEAIRRIRPAIPILLMSGFNEKDALKNISADHMIEFIQKPFTVMAFNEKLHKVMNESSGKNDADEPDID